MWGWQGNAGQQSRGYVLAFGDGTRLNPVTTSSQPKVSVVHSQYRRFPLRRTLSGYVCRMTACGADFGCHSDSFRPSPPTDPRCDPAIHSVLRESEGYTDNIRCAIDQCKPMMTLTQSRVQRGTFRDPIRTFPLSGEVDYNSADFGPTRLPLQDHPLS